VLTTAESPTVATATVQPAPTPTLIKPLAPPSPPVNPLPPPPQNLRPIATKAITQIQNIIQQQKNVQQNKPNLSPLEKLHLEFLTAYNEGIRRDLINPGNTVSLNAYIAQINNWKIKSNNGGGDCLFYAISDILNSDQNKMKSGRSQKGFVPLAPYTWNTATNSMEPISVSPNPYEPYTARSLRKLLVSYLNDHLQVFTNFVELGEADYTSNPKATQWRFIRNDDDTSFLSKDEILNIMKIPADAKERDPAIDGPDLVGDHRYYWGDEFAIRCFENIFQMKFILIDTTPNINRAPGVIREGDKVKIANSTNNNNNNSPNADTTGFVVQRDADNTVVETDDYERITVPNSEIDATNYQDDRYKIYCLDPIQTMNMSLINRYAFILYDPKQAHFEALYMTTKSMPEKYIFTPLYDIPSYIKYMMFVSCYRFQNNPSTSSVFSKIIDLNKELDSLLSLTNAKIQDKTKVIRPNQKLQYGGAPNPNQSVQNLATQYLSSSTTPFAMYDSTLGYYIVIDLELYPGDSIDAARSVALSCSNKYNKMWGALADMVGQPYQYSELVVPAKNNARKQKQMQRGGTKKLRRLKNITRRIQHAVKSHHNKTNKQKLNSILMRWQAPP